MDIKNLSIELGKRGSDICPIIGEIKDLGQGITKGDLSMIKVDTLLICSYIMIGGASGLGQGKIPLA